MELAKIVHHDNRQQRSLLNRLQLQEGVVIVPAFADETRRSYPICFVIIDRLTGDSQFHQTMLSRPLHVIDRAQPGYLGHAMQETQALLRDFANLCPGHLIGPEIIDEW